jgi:hypothetical protein
MDFATAPPSRSTAEQSPVDETTGRVDAMDWADEHDNIDNIDYIFGLAGTVNINRGEAVHGPDRCTNWSGRSWRDGSADYRRFRPPAHRVPHCRYLVPDATNASWLIQTKNKRGKCKAAEQEGPVPRIETKKTSIRRI